MKAMSTNQEDQQDPLRKYRRRKPPFLLRFRASTFALSLTVWLGLVVDTLGYSIVVPVIPYRLEDIGESNVEGKTGWLVAAYAGGLIVSSPPIAWLGAMIRGKRLPLCVSLLFMAGATVLMMETTSYPVMVIARVLQGFSGTGIFTLGLSLIADSVPEERLGVIAGTCLSGYSLGQVMGPPLGGVLYDKLGYRAPFIFSLCLIVVDLALRLCVIEKHVALKWIAVGHEIPNFESPCHLAPTVGDDATVVERAATPRKQKGATWAGVKKLLTDMRPVTACIFIFIEGLAFGGLVESGLTLRLDDHYGLSALQAGLVFIGLVVPTIITSPIAGWAADKWNAKWVVVAGAILTLPVYPLLTVNGPLALFVFFLALLGISLAMFIAPVVHDLGVYTSTVPGLNVLYSYSAFNFWYSVGAFIGPIVVGQAMQGLGVDRGWLVMCIVMPCFTFLCLPLAVVYLGDRLHINIRTLSLASSKQSESSEKEAAQSA